MKISRVGFRRLVTGSVALAMVIGCWTNSDFYQNAFRTSNAFDSDQRSLASKVIKDKLPSLATIERNLRAQSKSLERRMQQTNLRIACFGDSDTWGVLKFNGNVEGQTSMNYWKTKFDFENSYCKQLGPNVDNYGLPSSSPNYPSTCLQSMLGDKVYDVITIDYPLVSATLLAELVERLRERFPKALILMVDRLVLKKVKMIDPLSKRRQMPIELYMIRTRTMGARRKRQWGGIRDSMRTYDRTKFADFIQGRKQQKEKNIKMVENNAKLDRRKQRKASGWTDWEMDYRNSQKEQMEILHQKVNAIPVYIGSEETIEDSLLEVNDYYYDDGVSLNAIGHTYVANVIRDTILDSGFKGSNELGTFGEGDACYVWYTNKDAASNIHMGKHVELINYVDIRYSLEVDGFGRITLENPFSSSRTLYMSYMVTPGPDQLNKRAEINVEGKTTVLDTIGSSDYQKKAEIIVPRTIPVGKIPPGKSTIAVRELNDDVPLNFRIMGLTLTDEKHTPLEYEFLQKFWWKGLVVHWGGKDIVWA